MIQKAIIQTVGTESWLIPYEGYTVFIIDEDKLILDDEVHDIYNSELKHFKIIKTYE
jgi:hypothetical protein